MSPFAGERPSRAAGIYLIRHVASGRVYVGSAVSLRNRHRTHAQALDTGKHDNRYLQAAWKRYGASAFVFEVIEIVENLDDLLPREQHHIDALGAHRSAGGFNLAPKAGSVRGIKLSPEAKAKIAAARRGTLASVEARAALSAAQQALWSETGHRSKMLAARAERRGVKHSPEHCEKMSRALKGKKRTPEQCERIRQSQRGKTLSAEHRAKVGAAGRGRVFSAESLAKRSRSMTVTLSVKKLITSIARGES